MAMPHERPAAMDDGRESDAPSTSITLAQPVLNGKRIDGAIFVAQRGDALFLPQEFLAEQHIDHSGQRETINGRVFVEASTISGMHALLVENGDNVRIECSADCYDKYSLSLRGSKPADRSPVTPGAFLNYDFFAQIGDQRETYGGFFEAGLFSDAGTGLATLTCSNAHQHGACLRLETSWTIDDPRSIRRLRLGDAVAQAAQWGAPFRFAGVQWGTDFSLRPDFITFPTPTLSGEAALPSTVEGLIGDTQRFEAGLPAGPFSISDLPIVTGAGDAQLVVTDLLGRETVISTRYYAAPQLLKSGLTSFSLEAGFLREDFGVRSNAYGDAFAAGGVRHGATDWLTLGARTQASADHQTAGVTAAFTSASFGLIETAAAFSRADERAGGLFSIRHEWRSSNFSIGGEAAYATADFQRFGQNRPTARVTARSFVGYTSPKLGGASVNWTYRDERAGDDFSAIGFRYSKPVKGISLNFSALRVIEPTTNFIASLSLSMPLGNHTNASAGGDWDGDRFGGDARVRRSPPPAGGFGYHGRVAVDGVDRYEAGVEYRTQYGDTSAAYSRVNGADAGRFNIRGGLAVIGDRFVAAPSVTNSIAIVSVGEEEGVRVYHDRQLVGETDQDGAIVIPRLRAHERNVIAFEPADASFAASLGDSEIEIIPGLRTGHHAAFDVKRTQNIMARIIASDGGALAAGNKITDLLTGESYPIGVDGRIYIPDTPQSLQLRYEDDDFACKAEIRRPDIAIDAPYHHVGDIECIEMGREI